MRRTDVNAIRRPGQKVAGDVGEAWLCHPEASRKNPAQFDAVMLTGSPAPGTRACFVALPGTYDEIVVRHDAHRAAGAPSVLRLCPGPGGHAYPLEAWAVSPIPEYCEREDLCLILDFGPRPDGYPWAELVRFARDYPRLPMLALGTPLESPAAPRALDASPNLLFETSSVADEDRVRRLADLCASHGAYRFAYGSGRAGRDPLPIERMLEAKAAETLLATTAGQIADGTWGATHL